MGGFAHVMKTMMNWQPSGSPAWQRQQQEKIQQAQEDRAQQQADMDFHQHMMEMGALPVVNGMVKEQQPLDAPAMLPPDQSQAQPSGQSSQQTAAPSGVAYVDPTLTRAGYRPPPGYGSPTNSQQILQSMSQPGPSGDSSSMLDAQGNPSVSASFGGQPSTSQQVMQSMMPGQQTGNVTIVRKADPGSTVKWKDATGDQVAYELPSVDSQRWNQMQRLRAQALQSQTQAEEQGKLNAQNQQREQYGTPLSGDLAQQYGIDPDQKFLPAEKVQLATRYFPVVGAGLRGNAITNAAQIRAAAATYKSDLDNTTKQAIADQASMDRQNLLTHRDQWNQAIAAARNNGQGNLNARAFLNSSSRDMALHTTLLGDISKENQRQMLAQSLLANGPDGQPVTKDGDQFPDPFSGRTMTMNSAQRMRLGSALRQSQTTVAQYQNAAADLESRRDQILNRFGGGGSDASGNGKPLLWRGSGPAPAGSSPAPSEGPSYAPPVVAPGGPSSNGGSSAPAAGPGSVNWAPRGWGINKITADANAARSAAATPSGRPPNWADAGRASAGPAALLPGRSGTPPQSAPVARPTAKTATQSQVNAYAQKKGVTPAAALREFQAFGYTIQ